MARMPGTNALFVNRQLSWLQFDRRVLDEATDPQATCQHRARFLAIAANNLDEFFEVRVARTLRRARHGLPTTSPDGLPAARELEAVRATAAALADSIHRLWTDAIAPALEHDGITVIDPRDLNSADLDCGHAAVDPAVAWLAHGSHPTVPSGSVAIIARLHSGRHAIVHARQNPRLIRLPSLDHCRRYAFTGDLLSRLAPRLLAPDSIAAAAQFRVLFDGNLRVLTGSDHMRAVETALALPRSAVQLEICDTGERDLGAACATTFGLDPTNICWRPTPLDLRGLQQITAAGAAPPTNGASRIEWADSSAMFADLRTRDRLLHHPYDPFSTVEAFVHHAATDRSVTSIAHTLYRAGRSSPILNDLMRAATRGAQVTVVAELTARGDEATNLRWTRELTAAGVRVHFGLAGHKTHAKATVVQRSEANGIRTYCHLGTGNYNASTARSYTDLGLLTAAPDLCSDALRLFDLLTGATTAIATSVVEIAPFTMRDRLARLIEREADHARAGRQARIRAKMNALVDARIIRALYRAAQAGTQIDLVVRGACCLRPGVPGLSDRIRVVSVIGPLLEHSRVLCFDNAGQIEVFCSSADWMTRNLDRRVELLFPIRAPADRQRAIEIIDAALHDNVRARRILADGGYRRRRPERSPAFDSQRELMRRSTRARRQPIDTGQPPSTSTSCPP